jgi:hypothetical protein
MSRLARDTMLEAMYDIDCIPGYSVRILGQMTTKALQEMLSLHDLVPVKPCSSWGKINGLFLST